MQSHRQALITTQNATHTIHSSDVASTADMGPCSGLEKQMIGYNAKDSKILSSWARADVCKTCLQEPFHRRLAFDIGDLGLGVLTNSLELGTPPSISHDDVSLAAA